MLVGTWGPGAGCDQGRLTFNADGTFSASNSTADANPRTGTYQITGGKLTGSADGNSMPTVTLSVENGSIVFTNDSGGKETLVPCS
jgi:hypothetical protein